MQKMNYNLGFVKSPLDVENPNSITYLLRIGEKKRTSSKKEKAFRSETQQ